jgi:hypothetical protein
MEKLTNYTPTLERLPDELPGERTITRLKTPREAGAASGA